MDIPAPGTITGLLNAWSHGDEGAGEQLLTLLYGDLKQRARRYLRHERQGHTLQPTALVHEAYVRLAHQADATWQNRAQFLGLAALMMRRVLVDHARARGSERRGGAFVRVPLEEQAATVPPAEVDFGTLELALEELARQDPRQGRLVELRVFGGLSFADAAEVLGVSAATTRREWTIARAWLFRRLRRRPKRPS